MRIHVQIYLLNYAILYNKCSSIAESSVRKEFYRVSAVFKSDDDDFWQRQQNANKHVEKLAKEVFSTPIPFTEFCNSLTSSTYAR